MTILQVDWRSNSRAAATRSTPITTGQFPYKKIHALAGIGNPTRFFDVLRQAGFDVIQHEFPDHYRLQPGDLDFGDQYPIVMTEKDAVKCESFAAEHYWYLPVKAEVDPDFEKQLLVLLQTLEVSNEKHSRNRDDAVQYGGASTNK